ncbi:hypothetical protein, partial [Blautia wexlerae]
FVFQSSVFRISEKLHNGKQGFALTIIKGNAGTGIYRNQRFFFIYLLYSPFPRPCLTFIKFLSEHFPTLLMEVISGLANQKNNR